MDPVTLIILAIVGVLLLMMPVFLLIFFALVATVIYVWRKTFPFGWGIAEWITNRRNLVPFVLFMLIMIAGSIILLILSYVFATQVHWLGYLFLLLFLFILFIAETIFWGGFGLAVILWIIRLSHWAYALFRGGFWRTFRPGGPPDFQPVPVPLTNPLLVAPPVSRHTGDRRRKQLTKRRTITTATFTRPSRGEAPARAEEQAQVKKEASGRRPVARRRETSPTTLTSPSNEMPQAKEEAKQAKAQTKEDAKQAKAQAKEDAKQAKIQAQEEAKKAKEQVREAKRNQAMAEVEEKARAKEEAKQSKAQAIAMSEEKTRDKEEARKAAAEQKAKVKDQAELKEEEKEKGTPRLRRKRRLKGN